MEAKSERKVNPKTDQHCNLILTGFGPNFGIPFGSLWREKMDSKLHPKLLAPPGSSLASPGSGPALGGGTTTQGARARRLLHKKEVHDQARGTRDMDHKQVQRETISMEEPTTKKRNDHTKERREGNKHKRKSRTWNCLGPS